MERITVTQQDLLTALAEAQKSTAPEDARTLAEIAAASDLNERKVRAALKALAAQGRLVAHQVVRRGIDGRQSRVPAYTILPAA